MSKWLALMVCAALAAGMSLGALAASSKQEVSTAHAHALMAQNAKTVDMAHTHLHHVINCLVGPDGQGFDADAGTPCKGQGNGAIPDAKGNTDLEGKLQDALSTANSGLQSDDLSTVHSDAGKVAGALQTPPAQQSSSGGSW